MAQKTRAVLFANAMAATRAGFRANKSSARGATFFRRRAVGALVLVWGRNLQTLSGDDDAFREGKPGYTELMELVEAANREFASIDETEKRVRALMDEHRRAYRDAADKAGMAMRPE